VRGDTRREKRREKKKRERSNNEQHQQAAALFFFLSLFQLFVKKRTDLFPYLYNKREKKGGKAGGYGGSEGAWVKRVQSSSKRKKKERKSEGEGSKGFDVSFSPPVDALKLKLKEQAPSRGSPL